MDSSSSTTSIGHSNQTNWLHFSLSNNQLIMPIATHHHSSTNHSFYPLIPFNTSTSSQDRDGGDRSSAGATDFVVGSPKLEDFLGGSANSGSPPPFGQQTSGAEDPYLYDAELKHIATTFLRGFSNDQANIVNNQLAVVPALEPPVRKAVDTFGQRTSIYRGVTRHRWTGRYEAHLWDNSCRREGQSRKGRQVYLGGYDKEDKAARAYDLAALKYWGPTTTTNFPVCNYEKEVEDMKNMTRQEFVASLRRKSSGFSRGASIYRGVTRHHQHGRWQARIGRVAGNKDLYLGTFSTQEEAAEAYDIAAIKFRGLNAVTNFDMSRYDVKSIASSNLPVGGLTNKPKASPDHRQSTISDNSTRSDDHDPSTSSHPSASTLSFALQPIKPDPSDHWYNPTSGGLIQGTLPFSMDYCSNTTCTNNVDFLNGAGGTYNFQQQSNVSFGTSQIGLTGNNSNYCYGGGESGTFGNWINGAGAGTVTAPSLHHSFTMPAKANNVPVFQSPIFGIE